MSDAATFTAADYKDQGNRYFIARRYDDAVKSYTQAIIRNPQVPTYFTNRALCYLKCKAYEKACQDCRHALEHDRTLVKAHFFLGQALAEQGYHAEAISSLQRAADLARDQKLNFGDEIASSLRAAKRLRWTALEERRIAQEIALQVYLNQLMEDDLQRRLKALETTTTTTTSATTSATSAATNSVDEATTSSDEQMQSNEAAASDAAPDEGTADAGRSGREPPATNPPPDIVDNADQEPTPTEAAAEALREEHAARVAELGGLFAAVDERRRRRDVPDYLCGRISFEIMRDPVITPSGITYDRKDIEEHLQRVGHFDPVTRSDLTRDQLIPNFALKEVIDDFHQQNEWADQW